jgi:hypothetical protein
VLVYRDQHEEVELTACLAGLQTQAASLTAIPDLDLARELLIEIGVIESAWVDMLHPTEDHIGREPLPLAEASLAAGRLLHATARLGTEAARAAAVQLASRLQALPASPTTLLLKRPEGYAYYAVYPEAYMLAAERLAAEKAARTVVCIGLRSIGTSLSATVAAAFAAAGRSVDRHTIRPRGHPFAREPRFSARLADRFRQHRGALFLLVDEGPGLSGSSMAGTAEALARLGIDDARIVLMPAHLPDPSTFRSPAARERWPRHRTVAVSFEEAILPAIDLAQARDVGGGGWRAFLPPRHPWPAVQPQHERRKYLTDNSDGGLVLYKFAGVGREARHALRRATRLGEAGFAPATLNMRHGFLAQAWLPARPLPGGRPTAHFLATVARYVRFIATSFANEAPASHIALVDVIRTNVGEALGPGALNSLAGLDQHLRDFGEQPAVAIDARMLRHEWLVIQDGYLKADGVEHHADHFQPGCTDIAWDVAAFAFEHDLSTSQRRELAAAVGGRHLGTRLPFFHLAYLAARFGYAHLASETLNGTADGRLMVALARRYKAAMPSAIAALGAVLPDPPTSGTVLHQAADRQGPMR